MTADTPLWLESQFVHQIQKQARIYTDIFRLPVNFFDGLRIPNRESLPSEVSIPVITLGSYYSVREQTWQARIWLPNISDEYINRNGAETSPSPKIIWMSLGNENLNKSPDWVANNCPRLVRPASLTDGIALAITHPDIVNILKLYSIDLPGTLVESDQIFTIRENGKISFDTRPSYLGFPKYGSAVSAG